MSGIQSGFRFGGKHCMHDFGLLFVEDSGGRAVTHARRINEYQIAGASGTIRFPGEAFDTTTLSGSLFPLESPADEAAAQALMRQVDAWLYGPRDRLIFDYEPDKYRLAEVTGESKWSYSDWMDGGLEIEFIIQPFAFALFPTTAGGTVTGSAEYDFTVPGTEDAPLEAQITNQGASALTGAQITLGGKSWIFQGLSVAQDGTLTISCETPIGATITQGSATENAMPKAARFDLLAGHGALTAGVTLTFEGGSGSASVSLSARGRWK